MKQYPAIELKLYRHAYQKDVYLARNWSLVGGNEKSEFYLATYDLKKAIADANDKRFEEWFHKFCGEDGKTVLVAKMIDLKDVDFDGYKGTLKKELEFPVKEFELVMLTEAVNK